MAENKSKIELTFDIKSTGVSAVEEQLKKAQKEITKLRLEYYRTLRDLSRSIVRDTKRDLNERLKAVKVYTESARKFELELARIKARTYQADFSEFLKVARAKKQLAQELGKRELQTLEKSAKTTAKVKTFELDYLKTVRDTHRQIMKDSSRTQEERLKALRAYITYAKKYEAALLKSKLKGYEYDRKEFIKYVKARGKYIEALAAKERELILNTRAAAKETSNWIFKAKGLAFAIVRAEIILRGFTRIVQGVWNSLKGSVDTLEDYRVGIIKLSSIIAMFTGKHGKALAETYKQAKEYAEGLHDAMIDITRGTLLTTQQAMKLVETFAMFGQTVDLSSEKATEGLKAIINATALLTQGQRLEIQLRQEIRGLMTGTGLQYTMIYQILKAMNPEIRKQIELWRKQGTVIENVGKMLEAMGYAQRDLATTLRGTWTSVGSAWQKLIRESVRPFYEILVQIGDQAYKKLWDAQKRVFTPEAAQILASMKVSFQEIADITKVLAASLGKIAEYLLKYADISATLLPTLGTGVLIRWLFGSWKPTVILTTLASIATMIERIRHASERATAEMKAEAKHYVWSKVTVKEPRTPLEAAYFAATGEKGIYATREEFIRIPKSMISKALPPEPLVKAPKGFTREEMTEWLNYIAQTAKSLDTARLSWRDYINMVTKGTGITLQAIGKTTEESLKNLDKAYNKAVKILQQARTAIAGALMYQLKVSPIGKEGGLRDITPYLREMFGVATPAEFLSLGKDIYKRYLTMKFSGKGMTMGTFVDQYLAKFGTLTKEQRTKYTAALIRLLQLMKTYYSDIYTIESKLVNLDKQREKTITNITKQTEREQLALRQKFRAIIAQYTARMPAAEYPVTPYMEYQARIAEIQRQHVSVLSALAKAFETYKQKHKQIPKDIVRQYEQAKKVVDDYYNHMKEAERERYEESMNFWKGLKAGIRDVGNEVVKWGEYARDSVKNLAKTFETWFGDYLYNVIKGKAISIGNVFTAVLDQMLRSFTQGIAQMVTGSLMGIVKGSVQKGTKAGAFSGLQFGLTNLLGGITEPFKALQGYKTLLGTKGFIKSLFSPSFAKSRGLSSSAMWGSLLKAGGEGAMLSSIYQMFGWNKGKIGSTILASVGAAVGSAGGPPGAFIGATIGHALGGLFGGKKRKPWVRPNFVIQWDEQLGLIAVPLKEGQRLIQGAKTQGFRDQASQAVREFVRNTLNSIVQTVASSLPKEASESFKDYMKEFYWTSEPFRKKSHHFKNFLKNIYSLILGDFYETMISSLKASMSKLTASRDVAHIIALTSKDFIEKNLVTPIQEYLDSLKTVVDWQKIAKGNKDELEKLTTALDQFGQKVKEVYELINRYTQIKTTVGTYALGSKEFGKLMAQQAIREMHDLVGDYLRTIQSALPIGATYTGSVLKLSKEAISWMTTTEPSKWKDWLTSFWKDLYNVMKLGEKYGVAIKDFLPDLESVVQKAQVVQNYLDQFGKTVSKWSQVLDALNKYSKTLTAIFGKETFIGLHAKYLYNMIKGSTLLTSMPLTSALFKGGLTGLKSMDQLKKGFQEVLNYIYKYNELTDSQKETLNEIVELYDVYLQQLDANAEYLNSLTDSLTSLKKSLSSLNESLQDLYSSIVHAFESPKTQAQKSLEDIKILVQKYYQAVGEDKVQIAQQIYNLSRDVWGNIQKLHGDALLTMRSQLLDILRNFVSDVASQSIKVNTALNTVTSQLESLGAGSDSTAKKVKNFINSLLDSKEAIEKSAQSLDELHQQVLENVEETTNVVKEVHQKASSNQNVLKQTANTIVSILSQINSRLDQFMRSFTSFANNLTSLLSVSYKSANYVYSGTHQLHSAVRDLTSALRQVPNQHIRTSFQEAPIEVAPNYNLHIALGGRETLDERKVVSLVVSALQKGNRDLINQLRLVLAGH